MLTAKVNVEYQREYKGNGVVLYATDIQPAEKPADDIVYFN
jgi:putative membrane protein